MFESNSRITKSFTFTATFKFYLCLNIFIYSETVTKLWQIFVLHQFCQWTSLRFKMTKLLREMRFKYCSETNGASLCVCMRASVCAHEWVTNIYTSILKKICVKIFVIIFIYSIDEFSSEMPPFASRTHGSVWSYSWRCLLVNWGSTSTIYKSILFSQDNGYSCSEHQVSELSTSSPSPVRQNAFFCFIFLLTPITLFLFPFLWLGVNVEFLDSVRLIVWIFQDPHAIHQHTFFFFHIHLVHVVLHLVYCLFLFVTGCQVGLLDRVNYPSLHPTRPPLSQKLKTKILD